MVNGNSTHWKSVEQWSPMLFLIGGGLLVGHAAIEGIEAFTDLTPPPDVFVSTGHLVALVGLVGLYPVLVNRTPRVARTAIAVAVVPIVGWVVMTAAKLLAVTGTITSLNHVLPEVLIMLVVGSTILTYALFGAATLRVDEESRTVGLLVLAPAVLVVVLLVDATLTGVSALDGALIGGGLALSMLTLGYRLHTWDYRTEYALPTDDAAVG